ncbi:MAG: hypothetical protein HW421_3822 [Ignavibacteria bacterium]|nr:hypothetical protein [Ignavibacteria bacterium]
MIYIENIFILLYVNFKRTKHSNMKRKLFFNYLKTIFFLAIFCSYTAQASLKDSINRLINATSDKKVLIRLYKTISKIYYYDNDTNAVSAAEQQMRLAKLYGTEKDIADSYQSMALALKLKAMVPLAIDYLLKEKIIREKISDLYGLAYCFKNLGECYRSHMDYQIAFDYLKNALNLFKQLNNPEGIATTLNRTAATYYENYDSLNQTKAINFANQSNQIAEQIKDYDILSSNYLILGTSFTFFKEYKTSLNYFFKALELIEKADEKIHKSLILNNIAIAYISLKDFKNALFHANNSYNEALKYDVMVYKWLSSNTLCVVHKNLNQIDSAYKYLAISSNLRNILYNEERIKSVRNVEIKYQKSKYDTDIILEKNSSRMIAIIYSISILSILIILVLIYFRYLTLKKTNQKLHKQNIIIENQKEELARVNATKDKFFSIIAHDLRNPLGNFKNVTEQLSNFYKEYSEEERIEFLGLMRDSSRNLYSLLSNLLEWSRSQQGVIQFIPEEFDLLKIVDDVIDTMRANAEVKNIRIRNNIQEPIIVRADINMIITVIRNFISNAIKFTETEGLINIDLKHENGFVILTVRDSGVGMSQEFMDKLFQIDKSVTNRGTNNEIGTGLGLVLCKEFVDKNGGKITVQSQVGIGSAFSFTIPKK